MTASDPTTLVRQAFAPNLPPLARGYIVPTRAAPSSYSEGVYVILPEGSTEHLYGPCKWLAGHGTTKPQPGSACVVGFDDHNEPTILWWEGVQKEGFELSVAMAYRKAEQGIPSGVVTKLELDTVIKDPGSNMTVSAGNGFYTAPAEGYFQVEAAWTINTLSTNTFIRIASAGTEKLRGVQGKELQTTTVAGVIFCKKGDKISVEVAQESGAERKALSSSGEFNYFCVNRVGEGGEGKEGKAGPIVKLSELTAQKHHELTNDDEFDDHKQYARLEGRKGGQELVGGTEGADKLLLKGTAKAGSLSVVEGVGTAPKLLGFANIVATNSIESSGTLGCEGKLTVSEKAEVRGGLALSIVANSIFVTEVEKTKTINLTKPGSVVRITVKTVASSTVSGISVEGIAPTEGTLLTVLCSGESKPVILLNESTESENEFRFNIPAGNLELKEGEAALFQFLRGHATEAKPNRWVKLK